MSQTQDFIRYAQHYIPKFNVAFKNKSLFMKILGSLMFFNKAFMTDYITTIGYIVYVPTEEQYNSNQEKYLGVLTHEFVHMMDYKKYNIIFSASYLLPHLLVIFSSLSLLAIHHSSLWLISLIFIGFLLPLPAYFRMHWELRGYTMSAAFNYWRYGDAPIPTDYIDQFVGPGYYFMWPFKTDITNRLRTAFSRITDGTITEDMPYAIVSNFIKK